MEYAMRIEKYGICSFHFNVGFLIGFMVLALIVGTGNSVAGAMPECDSSKGNCQKTVRDNKPEIDSQKQARLVDHINRKKRSSPIPQHSVLVGK
jgi:hypothetical protein